MCQEVLEIMQNVGLRTVEMQMALQCAPLLAGLKVSNLLIIAAGDIAKMKQILQYSDVEYRILSVKEKKATILLFRREELEKYFADVIDVCAASPAQLKDVRGFAIGCPAMGAEVLEETAMEPFVMELETMISGKKVALFGSYGWGDGGWMRDWEDRMKGAGAVLVNGEGVICQEAQDGEAQQECEALGKALAESF